MLSYLLALAMALGSLALYLAAFFFPELHRKQDFLWSGVGLFYALILWLCAGQMTGALLLGQLASVSLIMALAWQTLWLRRHRTPRPLQTTVSAESLARWRQLLIKPIATWSQRWGLGRWWQSASQPQPTPVSGDVDGASPAKACPLPRSTSRRASPYEFVDEDRQPWPDVAAAVSTQVLEPNRSERTAAVRGAKQPAQPVAPSLARPSPQTPTATVATSPSRRPRPSWLDRIVIVKDWMLEVAQGLLKPKPKQAMIELPPRPRSIPRPDNLQETPGSAPATPSSVAEIAAAEASADTEKHDDSNGASAGDQDPESQEN